MVSIEFGEEGSNLRLLVQGQEAYRYPCRWTTSAINSVGPEGLEPSPGGLRVRCAAANTLIPSSAYVRAQNGRGGSRTLSLTLIRGPLWPLSYAPLRPVGPKGLEPGHRRAALVVPD